MDTGVFDRHIEAYEKWYETYPEVYQSEIMALREQFEKLPENIRGIEVGLGTGRFAEPLGIKEGIEPSPAMAEIAIKRGIEIMEGVAEKLPYADLQFDFVLFVTICFLKDVKKAFSEASRVLKPGGSIIVGFLDKEREIATSYRAKGGRSNFYENARFLTAPRVEALLLENGFRKLEFNQTLFGGLEGIKTLQPPKPGYGEGSFVVVMATKG